jgi:hypothetical protein
MSLRCSRVSLEEMIELEEDQRAVTQSLVIAHQISMENLQVLEDKCRCEDDATSTSYQDSASASNTRPEQDDKSGKDTSERNSTFLSKAASVLPLSKSISMESLSMEAKEQPFILAGKWTHANDVETSTAFGSSLSLDTSTVPTSMEPYKAAIKHSDDKKHYKSHTPATRTSQGTGPSALTDQAPQTHSKGKSHQFPHSFERWETLSAHWEGLTSFWIRRLEENTESISSLPLTMKLAKHVVDLSGAGANLFHAVAELQRLRASSERKFQRWFFATRSEMERQNEQTDMLVKALDEEKRGKELLAEKCLNVEQDLKSERNRRRKVIEYLNMESDSPQYD